MGASTSTRVLLQQIGASCKDALTARSRAEMKRSAAGEAVGDADVPMPLPWSPACPSTKLALKCLNRRAKLLPKRVSKKLNKNLHTHIPHLPEHGSQRVVRKQEPVRVRQLQKIALDDREAQLDGLPGAAAHGCLII